MKRLALVCALTAVSAFAQESEWLRLATEASNAEQAGNPAAALDLFVKAARVLEAGPPNMNLAATYNALAILYKDMGQPLQAIHSYRRSLALIESMRGKDNEEYAVVLGNLGTDLSEEGQHPEAAEKAIREAIAILTALPVVPEQRLAAARNALGEFLLHKDRPAEAEALLTQALEVFRRDPPVLGKLGAVLNNLAAVRRFQGRNQEAISLHLESIRLVEAEFGHDHPRLIRPLNNLATTYTLSGQSKVAQPVFERALSIGEASLGMENPLYARTLLNYSDCVKANGDKKRAKALAARARLLLENHDVATGRGMTVDVSSFH